MCSHYQAIKERLRLARMLKVAPEELGPITDFNEDMWPRRGGVFLRRRDDGSNGDAGDRRQDYRPVPEPRHPPGP